MPDEKEIILFVFGDRGSEIPVHVVAAIGATRKTFDRRRIDIFAVGHKNIGDIAQLSRIE